MNVVGKKKEKEKETKKKGFDFKLRKTDPDEDLHLEDTPDQNDDEEEEINSPEGQEPYDPTIRSSRIVSTSFKDEVRFDLRREGSPRERDESSHPPLEDEFEHLSSPPQRILGRPVSGKTSSLPHPLSPTSLPAPLSLPSSPEKGSVLAQRTLSPELATTISPSKSRVISPPNTRLMSPPFSSLLSSSSMGLLPPSLSSKSHRTLRERALDQKKFYESLHATWHQQSDGATNQNQDGTSDSSNVLVLDVGGELFRCSRSTLLATPSMLSAMFSGRHCQKPNQDGNYFIDRDPRFFPFILNWLRDPTLSYLEYSEMKTTTLLRILKESLFYQIHKLNEELMFHYSKRARREWTHPWLHLSDNDLIITRRELGGDAWCFAIIGDPLLSGVHYWEVLIHHTTRQTMMGVMPPYPRKVHNTYIGKIPDGRAVQIGYHCNGHLYQNNTCHGFGPTYTNGDRVGTLLDLEKRNIRWFINGEQTQTVSVAPNPKGYIFAITLFSPKDCVEILPNADCFPGGEIEERRGEDHTVSSFETTNPNSTLL